MITPQVGAAFGQERVLQKSCEGLIERGHEIFIIADKKTGDLPPHSKLLLLPGVSSFNFFTPHETVKKTLLLLGDFLVETQAEIAHFHDCFDPRIVRSISKDRPVFLTAHTVAPTCPSSARLTKDFKPCTYQSGWKCLWHQRTLGCLDFLKSDLHRAHAIGEFIQKYKALRRHVRTIFSISDYVTHVLLREGWDPLQVQYLPNPVDEPHAEPLPDAPKNLLVFAGRLTPLKGLEDLLRALPLIASTDWTLWVCGDGPERGRLEDLVVELSLSERVRFWGRTSPQETARIVASASAVIAPNRGPEAFGLTVAEACAQGIPVIVSKVPALNELVSENKSGFLFEAGNSQDLAVQIDRVLKNPNEAKAFAAKARNDMGDRFSLGRHVELSLKHYQSALRSSETF